MEIGGPIKAQPQTTPYINKHNDTERFKSAIGHSLRRESRASRNFLNSNSSPGATEHSGQLSPHSSQAFGYTQRNLFEILVSQTETRFYLQFSDWFWTATDTSVCASNQSKNGKYNVISVWFVKFLKRFLCEYHSGRETSISWQHAVQLRLPLEPLKHQSIVLLRGIMEGGGSQLVPHYVERRQPLGQPM